MFRKKELIFYQYNLFKEIQSITLNQIEDAKDELQEYNKEIDEISKDIEVDWKLYNMDFSQ